MMGLTAIMILANAGLAFAAAPEPVLREAAPARLAGHIYLNLVTGERVMTMLDRDPNPLRNTSDERWIADNTLPCVAFGQTGQVSGVVDDPSGTGSYPTGAIYSDWGDIQTDTVVDCVGVTWSTAHADTDADSDGFPDGVDGFGSRWSWFDIDNGYNYCGVYRLSLVSFAIHNLPGDLHPLDGLLATYTATVDLAASFDASLVFEIGDTDRDPQGAAVHNPGVGVADYDSDTVPDGDFDGDGLFDFSYGQRFYQPGTTDFDGDTIPDGDPAAAAVAGITLVAPTGPAVQTPEGDWVIHPVAPAPAAQGMEDAFDIYVEQGSGWLQHAGTFWYGGFSCDPADPNPYAQFEHILYGPGGEPPCLADLALPEGVLNFFDIAAFLTAYNGQDPIADFAAPFGVFNFFDVSAFLSAYNAGCP